MLQIHYDDEKILREHMKEVSEPFSNEDIELVKEMYNYLILSQDEDYARKHNLRSGVGLAAPQVGSDKRMLAIYINYGDGEHDSFALINPKVVSRSKNMCYLDGGEGCLSVKKDHKGLVLRNYKIIVDAFDALTNKYIRINAVGYLAVCMQHELDHLDGILYYDHINKFDPYDVPSNAVKI